MKPNYETPGVNQNPVSFQEVVSPKNGEYQNLSRGIAEVNNPPQLNPVGLQPPNPAGAPNNHYETLGVNPNASTAEIANAIPAKMGEVTEAAQVLSNPKKRRAYDFKGNQVAPPQVINQPGYQVPPGYYQNQPGHQMPPGGYQNQPRHQVPLELATRTTRVLAHLVDGIIFWVPVFFALLIGFILTQSGVNNETGTISAWTGVIILFLIIAILVTDLVLLALNGQTIGKKLLSIKIVNVPDGNTAGLGTIFWLRFMVGQVILALLLPIDIILFLFRRDRRSLHDLIAGTTVIEAVPGGSEQRSWWLEFGGVILLLVLSIFLNIGTKNMGTQFVGPENATLDQMDYLNSYRAKKAVDFLEQVKTSSEQYFSFMGKFPPNIVSIKGKTSNEYVAEIVPNPEEFYFQAVMSEKGYSTIGKQTIRLTYNPDTGWKCGSGHPNGVDKNYLPAHCRNEVKQFQKTNLPISGQPQGIAPSN
jgi:uncharacterized RDD family membrane protein YckC